MIRVNTCEARSRFSSLLAAVEAGEIIVICRDGKPVAELRSIPSVGKTLATDPELARVIFREDPSGPLDAGDWPG